MPAVTWQYRIDAATSEREVIEIVKDFIATLEHWEIARLPDECRPGKFFDASDVTTYALVLVRHDCEENSEASALLGRLGGFFTNASIRLSQIAALPEVAQPDSRQSA